MKNNTEDQIMHLNITKEIKQQHKVCKHHKHKHALCITTD